MNESTPRENALEWWRGEYVGLLTLVKVDHGSRAKLRGLFTESPRRGLVAPWLRWKR
jgi:hypothetical protein